MSFRRIALSVIGLILLSIHFVPVVAQSSLRIEKGTTAAALPITIRYESDSFSPSERLNALNAVARAMAEYIPLFGNHIQEVYIEVIPGASSTPGTLAAATYRDEPIPEVDGALSAPRPVCYIRIYDDAAGRTSAELAFTLAHEISHCFQKRFIPAYDANDPAQDWWAEGSAEWLATLVYPMPSASKTTRRAEYTSNVGINLFNHKYDAVFFWEFAAQRLGVRGAVAILAAMPSPSGVPAYLTAQIPDLDTFFAGYGQAIATERIRNQPPVSDMMPPTLSITEAQRTVRVSTDSYSFSLKRLTFDLPNPTGDRGVTVSVRAADILGVLLQDAQTGIFFSHSAPLRWCVRDGALDVVVSRAGGGTDDDIVIEVTDSAPCGEPTPTPEPEVGVPECLIGDWKLVEFPLPGEVQTFEGGDSGFIIYSDGKIHFALDKLVIQTLAPEGVLMVMSMDGVIYNGTAAYSGADLEYSFSYTSGTLMGVPSAMMEINGTEIDLSSQMRSAFLPGGDELSDTGDLLKLICSEDGETLTYRVSAPGTAPLNYPLERR